MDIVQRLGDEHRWKVCIAGGLSVVALWRWRSWLNAESDDWPCARKSPDKSLFRPKDFEPVSQRRHGYKHFPSPFPNGWMFVCGSDKLKVKDVMALKLWGQDMVAFRGEDGKVGILGAYCVHMGTHLGYGGYVEGNTVTCPYHEWKFDTDGVLKSIPYIEGGGPHDCNRKSNRQRKYPVIEKGGMIFAWMHADEEPPYDLWVAAPPEKNGLRPACHLTLGKFNMHCMEPAHNSCDWYHFQTVHSVLNQHWRSKFKMVEVTNWAPPARSGVNNSLDDDKKTPLAPDVIITDQYTQKLKIFGVTVPKAITDSLTTTQVRFSGAMLGSITMTVPFFGQIYTIVTMTPAGPFDTHMELWSFTASRWPTILARFMTKTFGTTINQDREVWEHRTQLPQRNSVKNDYKWKEFDKWLDQMYSPSSMTWTSELDW